MKKIYSTPHSLSVALLGFLTAISLTALGAYAQKKSAPPRQPVPPKVTKVQVFGGWHCPQTVSFMGKIFVTAPLTITYQWQRSDGTTTPIRSAQITAPFSHPLLDDNWQPRRRVPNLPSGNVFRDSCMCSRHRI